jgi:large subunit ribosomal protein L10e
MGLRPGRAMRKIERPWTRVSTRVPRKSYVAGVPQIKLHQFEMGSRNKQFELTLYLIAEQAVQLREQSMEAARVVSQQFLEKKLGLDNYFYKVLVYPHQVIREKPIATGAGADRYSTGMSLSFGKPSTSAARIKKYQKLLMLRINKSGLELAKQALKKAALKLSTPSKIIVEEA